MEEKSAKAELVREILAQKAKRSFRKFIELVKPDYDFNWHHLVLIAALERLANREFERLIVMMPPRHGKSEVVSVLFPAWCFARNPNEHIIGASYALGLASRMNRRCQNVLGSAAFKELFPEARFSSETRDKAIKTGHWFDFGDNGHYISAGVGGGITGEGATVGITDDPVKNSEEADSLIYRDKVWEWRASTFLTRFEPGAVEVICQTRWHDDDMTGRVLKLEGIGGKSVSADGKTEVIRIPALCEHKEKYRDIGEAIWPGTKERPRYPREWLLAKKDKVGSRTWNALYQQRPSEDEGGMIKRDWFGRYNPREYQIEGKRVNFYFDTAYTKNDQNDPTAGIAYVVEGSDLYVLECAADWMDFGEQKRFVADFASRNGYSGRSIIRIEPKATGISLVQEIRRETRLNVTEGERPSGDKPSRVNKCQGVLEGKRVYLPQGMAWVDSFLDECASFPNAAHDDRVDCLTGMIINEFLPNKKRGTYSVYTS